MHTHQPHTLRLHTRAGVRAPAALAVVKLFRLLPPEAERLHLPGVFTKVSMTH